jgi:hypothetical protein
MNLHVRRIHPIWHGIIIFVLAMSLCACGKSDAPEASKPTEQPHPAAAAPASPSAKADIPVIKACSLTTTAEVEAATGHKAMDPVEETLLDRASNCSFGDAGSPMIGGKPMSNVAEISVTAGGNDYFAGPVAQVNAMFDMAAKNAGEVEVVEGLGERAHWSPGAPFYTLRVIQGPYLVEVNVDPDFGGRPAAEQIARKALQKLP